MADRPPPSASPRFVRRKAIVDGIPMRSVGQGMRKHPPARVGDRFGDRRVTATMPRGYRGRSDERVRWRCKCGRDGESYVFNMRKCPPQCTWPNGACRG